MKNLTTSRFTRLVVLKLDHVRQYKSTKNQQTKAYWLCKCDCGNTKVIRGEHLTSGKILSCGCLNAELSKSNFLSHGLTGTPEYKAWTNMRSRVLRPDELHKKYYVGITIDKRWNKFENFLKDMGKKPTPKHELDRINNNGNYEPDNCRWVTRSENMKNTRRAMKYK